MPSVITELKSASGLRRELPKSSNSVRDIFRSRIAAGAFDAHPALIVGFDQSWQQCDPVDNSAADGDFCTGSVNVPDCSSCCLRMPQFACQN